MKLSTLALSLGAVLLLSGCSHKEVYKPEDIKGEWRNAGRLSASIVQSTESAALLDNGRLLTKSGEKNVKIPEEYRLLNADDTWIVTQSPEKNLVLFPSEGKGDPLTLELKREVAAASVQNDTVAILFANNEMAQIGRAHV